MLKVLVSVPMLMAVVMGMTMIVWMSLWHRLSSFLRLGHSTLKQPGVQAVVVGLHDLGQWGRLGNFLYTIALEVFHDPLTESCKSDLDALCLRGTERSQPYGTGEEATENKVHEKACGFAVHKSQSRRNVPEDGRKVSW